MILASAIAAAALGFIHLIASRLRFLQGIPRSKWLSMAGGASVAYVFIHLLPELHEWQEIFAETDTGFAFISHHIYLVAVLGLAVFYGLERAAKLSEESTREANAVEEQKHSAQVFWLHISSFAVYNAFIGYLLIHRDVESIQGLILFSVAMGLHFLVNDYGLLDHYEKRYLKKGRWIVTGAIILGWVIGALTEISEMGLSLIFAFIAGGVILNVLKEELPEERKSNFWAFLSGVAGYTALLLLV